MDENKKNEDVKVMDEPPLIKARIQKRRLKLKIYLFFSL